jgi:hypothetical protein
MRLKGWRAWAVYGGAGFLAVLLAAAVVWRDDILRTTLDPEIPFQTYAPPPAPDYARPEAWALLPGAGQKAQDGRAVDVFFIHPTTYNGGRHWNGPVDEPKARRQLEEVMLPNYAGPFFKVGRVFAPRYRQASLYSYLTRRDDALEARRFAYGDVARAFRLYLAREGGERPFIIVGVEQGGFLADRLLREVVAPDPALRRRLSAAYLIRTVVPAGAYAVAGPLPACSRPDQPGCVVGYAVAAETGAEHARELLGRALIWKPGGDLGELEGEALCVNPLLGRIGGEAVDQKANLGSANATDLEWGVRPAFLPRQVGAQCVGGVLQVSRPASRSLRPGGSWSDRLKVPGINLFYANLEVDSARRAAAWAAAAP